MKKQSKIVCIILAVLLCCMAAVHDWGSVLAAGEARVIYGDVDGNQKIDLQDARIVLRAALNLNTLDVSVQQAADVDGRAGITLEDAQFILKRALNLISAFPAEEANPPKETVSPEETAFPKESALPVESAVPKETDAPAGQDKILIAYFSKTGTTRSMAEYIQEQTGGALFEIRPVHPYPANYQETVQIVQKERAENARPQISDRVENMESYDIVFVGFPVWFGDEPPIIRTFLDSYDFRGKTVIPFCTSGGSSIGSAQENIETMLEGVKVLEGMGLTGRPQGGDERIRTWLVSCMDSVEKEEPVSSAGTENENGNQNGEDSTMKITVGNTSFTATFADNSSAEALKQLLAREPLTIQMSDYGNFEKVGPLGTSLPRNDEQITTEPGDIILYQGSSLTIYYDTNSWNFTRVGRIEGVTREELLGVLGEGDVAVTFSLE